MMKLTVKKGDLFLPYYRKRILAHACNCQGVWGSGVAAEFKKRFPVAFADYKKHCKGDKTLLPGTTRLCKDDLEPVASLFTSFDYGDRKDSPSKILKNTQLAVEALLKQVHPQDFEIHTPKINSGLFAVPWEQTEAAINSVLSRYNHTWIVWEL